MNKAQKAFLLACLLCGAGIANAQNGINSPYSRYGFGMMTDRAMGFNKAMGGVAQGFRNGQQINTANPASYSAVDSLTALFDLGLSVYNGNYKMGNLQQNAKNASFDYLAFQFRARRGIGITAGILPYTNINYDFSSTSETLDGNEDITSSYTFSGNGGLHQAFLGAGVRIFRPLSVGVNVSYLYGDYSHTSTMSLSQSTAYSLIRGYTADISTYKLDAGLQLTLPMSKQDQLTIGVTYGLGHDIKNRAYRYTETLNSSSTVESVTYDTLRNAFQLPHSIAAGVTYVHANKWRVGADFTLEKWSKCKFPSNATSGTYTSTTGQLYDMSKVAVGGEYTPNANSLNHLLSRVSYRVGGYYSRSYAKTDVSGILSDKPYEFGLSAGFSIPIQNRNLWYNSPRINVAFQWIHSNIPYLSTTTVNDITTHAQRKLTENYLKLSVGITFSERWFYKWKVQ